MGKMESQLKARAKRLRDSFNLTIAEWEIILAFQLGVCWICGKKQKSGKRLATDHRHIDGLVRGLLCSQCNRLLGRIEATFGINVIKLLARVISFLSNPPATQALGRETFGYAGRVGTKKHRKFVQKQSKIMIPSKPLLDG